MIQAKEYIGTTTIIFSTKIPHKVYHADATYMQQAHLNRTLYLLHSVDCNGSRHTTIYDRPVR